MKCFTFVKTRTVGIFVTVFVREQNFRFVFIALNNYSFIWQNCQQASQVVENPETRAPQKSLKVPVDLAS